MSKPMFTKRHHAALASAFGKAINKALGPGDHAKTHEGIAMARVEVLTMLALDNPEFNLDLFYKAMKQEANG